MQHPPTVPRFAVRHNPLFRRKLSVATSRHSVFRSAAQVAGLLTAEQLDAVSRAACESQSDIPAGADTPTDDIPTDEIDD